MTCIFIIKKLISLIVAMAPHFRLQQAQIVVVKQPKETSEKSTNGKMIY
jgi:hypothetical protein